MVLVCCTDVKMDITNDKIVDTTAANNIGALFIFLSKLKTPAESKGNGVKWKKKWHQEWEGKREEEGKEQKGKNKKENPEKESL